MVLQICSNCADWTRSKKKYEKEYGTCTGLFDHDNVDIELKTGWDGGVVSRIETKETFCCGNFKIKEG